MGRCKDNMTIVLLHSQIWICDHAIYEMPTKITNENINMRMSENRPSRKWNTNTLTVFSNSILFLWKIMRNKTFPLNNWHWHFDNFPTFSFFKIIVQSFVINVCDVDALHVLSIRELNDTKPLWILWSMRYVSTLTHWVCVCVSTRAYSRSLLISFLFISSQSIVRVWELFLENVRHKLSCIVGLNGKMLFISLKYKQGNTKWYQKEEMGLWMIEWCGVYFVFLVAWVLYVLYVYVISVFEWNCVGLSHGIDRNWTNIAYICPFVHFVTMWKRHTK